MEAALLKAPKNIMRALLQPEFRKFLSSKNNYHMFKKLSEHVMEASKELKTCINK